MDTRAQHLRKNLTGPERKLWSRLRELRDEGFHLRRQVPFGAYVLDFVSHRERLVIEVDGAHHEEHKHRKHDEVRTRFIQSRGYRVLRFSNYDVLLSTNSVVRQIKVELHERRRVKFDSAVPPPDPSPPIGSERSTAPQRGR
jgi:very-short-patch-repair endonuclease